MGRSRKYEDDVAVSAPYMQLACQQGGAVPTDRTYVDLTCNHCKHSWKMPEDSLGTNRASESLNHLRACKAFAATGKELPPPRAKKSKAVAPATEATALEQLVESQKQTVESQKQTKLLEQQLEVQGRQLEVGERSERLLTAICKASGISEHSSDDEEKIERRAKRKFDETTDKAVADAYTQVAKAGKFSPPRDGEPSVAIGRRVYQSVEATTAAAAQVPGLKGQLRDVHSGLHIAPDAPPVARTEAILSLNADKQAAEQHFDTIGLALGLSPNAPRDEQIEAIVQLNKAVRVAQTAPKGRAGRKGGASGDATGDAIVRMVEAKNSKVQTAAKILVRELPDGEAKDRMMRAIPTSGNVYDKSWQASGSRHV